MAFRYPPELINQLLDPQNLGLPLHQRMSTNGDGTGDTLITGDYSSTPTDFYIEPAPNEAIIILHFTIILCANDQVRLVDYGSLPALPNGIQLIVKTGGFEVPILGRVKNNQTLFHLTEKGPITTRLLGGENLLHCHLDFSHRPDQYSKLFGPLGDKFTFRCNDDFSGLCEHSIVAYGFKKFLAGY